MSLSGSDSDEFFDAEDASLTQIASEDLSTEPASLDSGTHFFIDKEALRLKADEVEQRARRIEERRQRLLREEEEPSHPGTSALPAHFDDESSSYSESIASSSVEGLYLTKLKQQTPLTSAVAHQPSSSSSSSPSQLLPENRLQPLANSAAKFSSNSCGVKRAGVGKNGTNNSNSHNTSNNNHSTNEPDLVASTKPPTNFPQEFVPPIAPPRRRKTSRSRASYAESRRSPNPSAYDSEDAVSINSVVPLGLPAPPVETPTSSIGRDFSLPIENVQRGQFVVKPQDNEEDKGLSKEEVRLCENATGSGKETSKEGTGGRLPRRSSNASVKTLEYKTPENSLKATNALPRLRTDSGRQLSDLEILEQIEVLNLDTGEKIPLSVAEDKLPQCVNPLSLHLMRITQEYVR